MRSGEHARPDILDRVGRRVDQFVSSRPRSRAAARHTPAPRTKVSPTFPAARADCARASHESALHDHRRARQETGLRRRQLNVHPLTRPASGGACRLAGSTSGHIKVSPGSARTSLVCPTRSSERDLFDSSVLLQARHRSRARQGRLSFATTPSRAARRAPELARWLDRRSGAESGGVVGRRS